MRNLQPTSDQVQSTEGCLDDENAEQTQAQKSTAFYIGNGEIELYRAPFFPYHSFLWQRFFYELLYTPIKYFTWILGWYTIAYFSRLYQPM